jgi:hypothetical protein
VPHEPGDREFEHYAVRNDAVPDHFQRELIRTLKPAIAIGSSVDTGEVTDDEGTTFRR